ncbi:MAG: hypothetical protein OEW05_06925 [Candidatus Aminicenantes bacterium]|nr:hypothetical protein [Candidatus Aminicenantes bacterium]
MSIAYLEPLGRAWERMKQALFRPFDLHKWFVVGFNAFLAGLADGQNGGGGGRGGRHASFREFLDFPGRAWEWLNQHPGWFAAIVVITAAAIVVGIVLLWLSSRGKFMFLDNVVHNRAEIANPWRQYRREGDSLFLWRLVFSLVAVAVFVAFVVFFFATARDLYDESPGHHLSVSYFVGLGLIFLALIVVAGFVSLFLDSFVVPLMYKDRVTAVQGWRRFLALLGQHPFAFILFGLLMFGLILLFVAAVVVAGIITCCIGWILLVIPYIGTVVTLPVWYTFRAFSLEFLAQFGPEYVLVPPPTTQTDAQTA